VGMPGMSGWQLVREAKQLKPDLCIYMLTGWAREIAAEMLPKAMRDFEEELAGGGA